MLEEKDAGESLCEGAQTAVATGVGSGCLRCCAAPPIARPSARPSREKKNHTQGMFATGPDYQPTAHDV